MPLIFYEENSEGNEGKWDREIPSPFSLVSLFKMHKHPAIILWFVIRRAHDSRNVFRKLEYRPPPIYRGGSLCNETAPALKRHPDFWSRNHDSIHLPRGLLRHPHS